MQGFFLINEIYRQEYRINNKFMIECIVQLSGYL